MTKLSQQTFSQENKEGKDTSNSFCQVLQIKEESDVPIKRESGVDEEAEIESVGESEVNKKTTHSPTLILPTLKKEKDIKHKKDVKKESVKTEHRDPAHRTRQKDGGIGDCEDTTQPGDLMFTPMFLCGWNRLLGKREYK
ncbi:e3 ubiquitin-protein ligase bre1 [Lasius niger]|uniref:E3 ubiquitin-protein ligase bre1 n=1 Tax=Lasius niger TaxID=67767 RepID=A0A0J7K4M4_LASNI|nr:e3 ubiquitin-protein ligase bre1 [Lasius niger]